VPLNQNLIQSRRRSFAVPFATASSLNVPASFAAAARSDSDHPINENSQRWPCEAIATVSASRAHLFAGVLRRFVSSAVAAKENPSR
jgi:hypothetical protein